VAEPDKWLKPSGRLMKSEAKRITREPDNTRESLGGSRSTELLRNVAAQPPLILYSTSTWLAFIIGQKYFHGEHHVWCTPYFDPSAVPSVEYTVPPSSSPAEIYRGLRSDITRKERHSKKIKANKAGILRGAQEKLAEGTINEEDAKEIAAIVAAAEVPDFAPLIFVIPYHLVKDWLSTVPVSQRAHPLSVEFVIKKLPRICFDVLKVDGD
jgi:hypothetical protein